MLLTAIVSGTPCLSLCLLTYHFSFCFLKQTTRSENFLNLPMHTARIPPVAAAPATITAVLAMHAGHICPSSELLIRSRRLARTGIHQLRASPQGLLNQGRPIPRLAPVIKIVLFSMFIWFSFYGCPFCLLLRIARRGRVHPARKILRLPCFGFPKSHVSAHVFAVSLCPAAHASEWSDDCPSQFGQRIFDSNGLRLGHTPGD